MKKHKQKANRRPPLSALDKAIYTAVFVLWAVLLFFLVVITAVIRDAAAFKDSTVIAYRNNGCEFLALPLFIDLLLSAFLLYFATRGKSSPYSVTKALAMANIRGQRTVFRSLDRKANQNT